MTEGDLGWTPGILDGEGHFGIAKGPNYGVKLSVGNTDLRMLNRLRELWGGRIYINAHISGRHNAKTFWHWQLTVGKPLFAMLRQVQPFLVAKQEQATLILEMEEWHGRRTRYNPSQRDEWRANREAIFVRMRRLTHRGRISSQAATT